MIVPDGHDEHDSGLESLSHLGETSLFLVQVVVSESGLLGTAEVICDGVSGHAFDCGFGVGDNGSALDVESLDLGQFTGVSSILFILLVLCTIVCWWI